MTLTLRDYQARAVHAVEQAWAAGLSRVCLVAPTGAGKTVMLAALRPDLVIVHRRELEHQAHERIPGALVCTVQGLLASGARPPAARIALDECHHYAADEWRTLSDSYPDALIVGATATPERGDGRPLSLFSALVVAASYSELLDAGHLCRCRVYVPPRQLDRGLALEPLDAYQRHTPGERALVFVASIELAEQAAAAYTAAGYPCEAVTERTPAAVRASAVERYRTGELVALANVYTLTEGLDVPETTAIVLARSCGSAGMYLQIAGRGLRPAPGKAHCTLLDLTGASLEHGLPTDDRAYSLDGDGAAIQSAALAPIRNCLECGAVYESARIRCPLCGWAPPVCGRPPPRIWSLALAEVYQGSDTAAAPRKDELRRLLTVADERGFGWGWAAREYERTFGAPPTSREIKSVTTNEERYAWYERLQQIARQKGYKPGWASHQYRTVVGTWPRR